MIYPHEKAASRGDPMPENLSLSEAKAYQAMRSLYAGYRRGAVDRDTAAREKAAILAALARERQAEAFQRNRDAWVAGLYRRIEAAAVRYRKERTVRNADDVLEAVYGVRGKDV